MTNKKNITARPKKSGAIKGGTTVKNRKVHAANYNKAKGGFPQYGAQARSNINAGKVSSVGLPRDDGVRSETVHFTAVAKQPSREERAIIQKRRENAALSRKKPRAKRKPVMRTLESREVKPFPWSIVIVSVIGTILFMTMIYNNVQINEKTAQIESYSSEVSKLEKGLKDLTLELERKNDLRAIEERALELGMVKSDELSKQYISISPEDKVEVVEEEKEGKRFHFTGVFETIYQKISDFLEFIR